ncbi:corticoliberin [Carettochelys insculpta]|uniref:corticoliberin n=1 Tax=Carettochelys insculpta TaxID=44489 RepID=UPI003EC13303
MKLQLLVSAGALLLALLPGHECRVLGKSPASAPLPPRLLPPPPSLPVLLRMGEEYFLRLGSLAQSPAGPGRAALQPLPERSPESPQGLGEGGAGSPPRGAAERERRSEEPPISLDLTFHLLREVLEMARAEQLAQQAHSNRKLMEIIGK